MWAHQLSRVQPCRLAGTPRLGPQRLSDLQRHSSNRRRSPQAVAAAGLGSLPLATRQLTLLSGTTPSQAAAALMCTVGSDQTTLWHHHTNTPCQLQMAGGCGSSTLLALRLLVAAAMAAGLVALTAVHHSSILVALLARRTTCTLHRAVFQPVAFSQAHHQR